MAGKPLYDQMSALLAYANGITGASDTKLGDAVHTLADGYGQGGVGLSWADVLYDDNVSITFTSTTANTAKTLSGFNNIATYPFVVVEIQNADTTAASSKFIGSVTVLANTRYSTGQVTASTYGNSLYYNSNGVISAQSSTTYGLWVYTISASYGTVTIRGRCSSSYFSSLTGTYKIRILGVKF